MRTVAIYALLLLGSCESRDPLVTQIAQIESQIEMPEGAAGIDSYGRFYSISGNSIRGEFVRQGEMLDAILRRREVRWQIGSAIYIVEDGQMPSVRDGGCDRLNLSYDRNTGALTGPHCNFNG